MCLPGSKKAVKENLDVIEPVLKHILDLISDNIPAVSAHHAGGGNKHHHVCPHKSGNHDGNHSAGNSRRGVAFRDRQSPYPMVSVEEAVSTIKEQTRLASQTAGSVSLSVQSGEARGSVTAESIVAKENLPNYRASIKDG